MRDVLHGFVLAAVIVVAALCTLVQLSDVNRAFDRLGRDEQAVIQQVSSDRAPHRTAPREQPREAGPGSPTQGGASHSR